MIRKIFRKIPYNILMIIGIYQDKEYLTQTRIAEHINSPITSINYQITKFYQEGLIDSKKNIKFTEKGNKLFKYLWNNLESSKRLRAHNIQIICDIVCSDDCLRRLHTVAKPFTNKRYRGLKLEIEGCDIMIYNKTKLSCVLPNIYGNNEKEIIGTIGEFLPQLIDLINQEYGIKVLNYEIAKLQTMHVAVLNSLVAESYILRKKAVYSAKGIDIDKSHGRYELEATGLDALKKISGIIKYEDLFRENKELKMKLRKMKGRDK